jgi:hypothetical protein
MASVPLFEKKCAVKTGKLAETFGELSLVFVVIEIRNVNDPGGLLADGFYDARMSMAKRVDPQPGNEIKILLAFEVVKEDTFAALKRYWITVISGEKKALFKIGNLIEAGHASIVKRMKQ